MLKTTGSLDKPVLSKNNGSKPAISKNNSSKPAFKRNDSDGEVEFGGGIGNSVEYAKMLGKSKGQKLSKSKKSKSKKTFKS